MFDALKEFLTLIFSIFAENATKFSRQVKKLELVVKVFFCKLRAESMSKALNAAGWPCTYISGNMDQMRRTVAITQLKSFKCR